MTVTESPPRGSARARLLDAAVTVIRTKGLSATSVDELCAAAGVTKGAFFHHFESKQALAVAAAEHWSATTGALFAGSGYHDHASAVERVLGYVDLRIGLIAGDLPQFTCLVGTMVQEAFATNPEIRDACGASILGHAATLEADLVERLGDRHVDPNVDAGGLARYMMAVIQGAFVVSKAANDPNVAITSLVHLRRYLVLLFGEDAS
jgi:TetR/AcrR family transcriptional repressor of nem operon